MASTVTDEGTDRPSPGAPDVTSGPNVDRWFGVLWPAAVLFHLAGNGGHLLPFDRIGALQLVLVGASIHAIVRPRPSSIAAVAALFLLVFWWKLPVVGNHEVLLALVAMTIVISVVIGARDGRWWPSLAAPAIRLVLIIGYGFIALSKLNTGFFDAVNSCAVIFGDDLLGRFGPSGPGPTVPALPIIGATAAIELAIPPLLIFRRTRTVGVVVALGFHFVLAIDPTSHVWDFSAALLPMFGLFGSPQLRAELDRTFDRIDAIPRNELALGLLTVTAAHAMVVILDSRLGADSTLRPWFGRWLIAYPLWLVVGSFVLLLAVRAAKTPGHEHAEPPPALLAGEPTVTWIPARPLLIVVVLAVLNGMGPYLQYRTAAAFNMYSNLETIDGRSNHLLLWPLAGAGGEPSVAGVIAAEDGSDLGYYVENELAVPVDTLDRYLRSEQRQDPMIVIGDGPPVSARSIGLGADGATGPFASVVGIFERKLLFKRAVDLTGEDRCLRQWGPLG